MWGTSITRLDGEGNALAAGREEVLPSVVRHKGESQPRSQGPRLLGISFAISPVQLLCHCYFAIIIVICADPPKQNFNFLYTYLFLKF